MRLRPYQAAPARAILRSATRGDGHTFTVLMARQAGKNELSAWLETALLTRNYALGGTGIKAAPTKTPQAKISFDRLIAHLDAAGFASAWRREGDSHIRLGRARWTFYSASPDASVVGSTAQLLLEGDEAQDINPDKWNKDFRPMAATTNATTVLYGTPWSDDTLLAQAIADNLDRQAADGIQRHFQSDWWQVAKYNAAYGRYVAAERQRLGADHPLYMTQYELATLPGQGRLLSPAQLSQLAGEHPPELAGDPSAAYCAGLDVAGEDDPARPSAGRDSTVLTIARLEPQPPPGLPIVRPVAIYETTGAAHDQLYATITDLLHRVWAVRHVAVDATAAGEGLAVLLARALGRNRVTAYRFTEQSKSHLGYQLQAAASLGRLRLPPPAAGPAFARAWEQLRLCRATYKPNRALAWAVDAADGHDDHVASIALCLEAAASAAPRLARARMADK